MIVDFNDFTSGHTFEADICIIGSGAAGITIAREFFGSAYSVVILEGGGRREEAASQALYDSEVVGVPHNGIHTGRARVFGGTTSLWAGQTLPLDDTDFQRRPWVPDNGWPIARADLEPYYRRAEATLHLGPIAYDASRWPYPRIKLLPLDPNRLRPLISQFSPKPNFALAYGDAISQAARVCLVLHANAVALRAHESAGSVERVEFRSLAGNYGWARAKLYVLCCGGIETPRLLLASDDVQAQGLGNQNDLVGRYFQDHVQAAVAPIHTTRLRDLQSSLLPFVWRGIAYSPKAALSYAMQQKHEVLNATVGLTSDQFVSEDSPVESAKRIIRGLRYNKWDFPVWKNLSRVLARPHEVAAAGFRRAFLGRPAFQASGTPYIGIQCECDPNPASRVTLSRERDALGSPRARLDWRLSPIVRKTAIVAVETFAGEMARLQLGRIASDTYPLRTLDSGWETQVFDANHHIGTARMSDDPNQGVVDRHCRVHSVQNLFVASTAVFPTGGHSNPTFTMLALAIRLADHLKGLLARGAATI